MEAARESSINILNSLGISLEDITDEQKRGLEEFANKIPDPSKMSIDDAMKIVNTLGIDLESVQKKARRVMAEMRMKSKPVKIGPNEKCRCGSGVKYKKCCRDKDSKSFPV